MSGPCGRQSSLKARSCTFRSYRTDSLSSSIISSCDFPYRKTNHAMSVKQATLPAKKKSRNLLKLVSRILSSILKVNSGRKIPKKQSEIRESKIFVERVQSHRESSVFSKMARECDKKVFNDIREKMSKYDEDF